jgi:hypothetical protein
VHSALGLSSLDSAGAVPDAGSDPDPEERKPGGEIPERAWIP